MRVAYFDCFHGAAGDMLLASLLHTGLKQAALEEVLQALPLRGYTLKYQQVVQHHIVGGQVEVEVEGEQPSRTWADIRLLLETSSLPSRTRAWALGTFQRLARAEAKVHNVPIEEVHFHEIGAVDSLVDIVGVCAALDLLNIEKVYASVLPLGRGWIMTQHGLLPAPAPATLALLAEVNAPVEAGLSEGELLTPTAAALLAEFATFEQPSLKLQQVGYGFGQRSYPRLNGLRVWLGEAFDPSLSPKPPKFEQVKEEVVEIRCNLDDSTGEVIAYVIEGLLKIGALDAWAIPLTMKKGRPGIQLSCLVPPASLEKFATFILCETSTFGLRWQTMERVVADRKLIFVQTPWGEVRVKQKLWEGEIIARNPEYEDCAALARKHGIPLMQVYEAALRS